jgi:hypothetical protein
MSCRHDPQAFLPGFEPVRRFKRYSMPAPLLHAVRLPFPDDAWLDELIIELAGWFYDYPLAADVPAPQIETIPEQ